jgi:hypothetical protein
LTGFGVDCGSTPASKSASLWVGTPSLSQPQPILGMRKTSRRVCKIFQPGKGSLVAPHMRQNSKYYGWQYQIKG